MVELAARSARIRSVAVFRQVSAAAPALREGAWRTLLVAEGGVTHDTTESAQFCSTVAGRVRHHLLRDHRPESEPGAEAGCGCPGRRSCRATDAGGLRWHAALGPRTVPPPAFASAEARTSYTRQMLRRAQTSAGWGGLAAARILEGSPAPPVTGGSKEMALKIYPVVEESRKDRWPSASPSIRRRPSRRRIATESRWSSRWTPRR